MIGWIIKNRFSSKQNTEKGDILGNDGLIYQFYFDDQSEEFSNLDIKTQISFTLLSKGEKFSFAIIEDVLPEKQDMDIARYDQELQTHLSPSRYFHSFRVSKIAQALAKRFDYSPKNAEIAGLLHDIAKEKSREENQKLVKDADLNIASFELNDHISLHAAAGSVLAATHLGIKDSDILDAIRYHNGRPAMTKLEKIIYLSDNIDYFYKNDINSWNEIACQTDLNAAALKLITLVIPFLVEKDKTANIVTESTFNYLLMNLEEEAHPSQPMEDSSSSLSDELFDRILEINAQRGLPIPSVKNIRDFGGCTVFDGRKIRHGMLVRSGRLADLTMEDSIKLKELGIRTIIDLRTDEEVAEAPDQHVEEFRWIHCPLPSLDMTDYQKNILEKYLITPKGEEKTYYLSEYLNCISMKEMYSNILNEENSKESLRKVFDLLAEPGEDGILFHCTSGKDRTGIISAFFLLALGASEQEIEEDYYTSALATFSETEFFAQSFRQKHYSSTYLDEMRYFSGVGMNIADDLIENIIENYGSLTNYLKELMSDEKISILREKYT